MVGAWKPRTHWRPRDTGFRAFGRVGTLVGARKTSVGIQSGIQGWRFSIGKRGKLAAVYGASSLMASWPSILLPIGCNPFPVEDQTTGSGSERPLSRRLGAPPYGPRAGRKNVVHSALDAKVTIANLWFLEYDFSQKHIRL